WRRRRYLLGHEAAWNSMDWDPLSDCAPAVGAAARLDVVDHRRRARRPPDSRRPGPRPVADHSGLARCEYGVQGRSERRPQGAEGVRAARRNRREAQAPGLRVPGGRRLVEVPALAVKYAWRPTGTAGAGIKAVLSGISLFDWRQDIFSSRPGFRSALRAVAVKGGRRPSRSDLPLTVASTATDLLSRATRACRVPACSVSTTATIPRGARHRARIARHELVFGRSGGIATTMQSCASAAKLRGGGPILNRGAKAIVQYRGAAASVRHLQPSVNLTLGCSNSMAFTPPGEAVDLPASRRSLRTATKRRGACEQAQQSSSCASRLGHPPFASKTTRSAGCPSDASGDPRRVRSSRGARGRCQLWQVLARVAFGRSRLELRSGRHSARGPYGPVFRGRTPPGRAYPRSQRRRRPPSCAAAPSHGVARSALSPGVRRGFSRSP